MLFQSPGAGEHWKVLETNASLGLFHVLIKASLNLIWIFLRDSKVKHKWLPEAETPRAWVRGSAARCLDEMA